MQEEKDSNGIENKEAETVSEVENLKKEMLYLKAETENFRKRLIKEQENILKFANERILRDMLQPVDLLEKAIKAGESLKEQPAVKNFYLGIELTHRELLQLLNRQGLELFGEAGEKFDPSKHEAITQVESDVDEDQVQQVLQKGANYNGRLLQPAKVVVAKAKSKD